MVRRILTGALLVGYLAVGASMGFEGFMIFVALLVLGCIAQNTVFTIEL
jgi:hypothetical protein